MTCRFYTVRQLTAFGR